MMHVQIMNNVSLNSRSVVYNVGILSDIVDMNSVFNK